MTKFPDVFEGIGKFAGEPYKIQLDLKVPPKQTPADLFLYILKEPSRLKSKNVKGRCPQTHPGCNTVDK